MLSIFKYLVSNFNKSTFLFSSNLWVTCNKLHEDFISYLNDQQIDFISFKANHLLEKTKNDPINISKTINDIITSISIIPDAVSRSVYIKKTAQIFEMDEQLLITEVQKKLRSKREPQSPHSLPSIS